MADLPSIVQKFSDVDDPNVQFEKLVRVLLKFSGGINGFQFETGEHQDRSNIDGWVERNYPNIPNSECPVAFRIKWLTTPINKSPHNKILLNDFDRALDSGFKFRSYILITPHDLSPPEETWLNGFQRDHGIKTYHIGYSGILELMRDYPALYKYYYGPSSEGETHFDMIYKKYIRVIFYRLQFLEFIGLPTGQYQKQELLKQTELTRVYIPLDFNVEKDGQVYLGLPQVIKRSLRCVIQGVPGSGKSTLAKYLSWHYSSDSKRIGDLQLDERLPFIVPIRDYARMREDSKSGVFSFIEYFRDVAEKSYKIPDIDRDFFLAILELGKAIVLFDGLDEVSENRERIEIARRIAEFSQRFPETVVWVTTRIFGYSEDIKTFFEPEFHNYFLAPVSRDQAMSFIRKWYGIQMPSRQTERNNRINALKKAIHENEGVKRLHKNPLLLTMMTLVHQFEGTLPDDRGRLYEKCVELLLKTWQDQKYISRGEVNPLEDRRIRFDEQMRLLAAVAFHIQKRNEDKKEERGLIGELELEKVLLDNRYDPRRIKREDAQKDIEVFIDYIRDRVGLFVESGMKPNSDQNLFSFIHLSFLEYLCAYQITEDKSKSRREHIDTLLKYMVKPTWEEIILLALYIFSNSPNGNVIIDDFCVQAFDFLKKHPYPKSWYLLGRAVRDNISFAMEDTKQILRKIVSIWMQNTTQEEPVRVLTEIVNFSRDGRAFLKEILLLNIRLEPAPKSFASLSLYIHFDIWFDVNSCTELIDSLKNSKEKEKLLPYLPVYRKFEPIARFVEQEMSARSWNIYYNNAMDRMGTQMDRLLRYQIGKKEMIGYTLSLWSDIFSLIQERRLFVEKTGISEKERDRLDGLRIDFARMKMEQPLDIARIDHPLSIFHPYLDQIRAYLDAPDNINVVSLEGEKLFRKQDLQTPVHINQDYIYKWIDKTLEFSFNDLKKKLPLDKRLSIDDTLHFEDVRMEFSKAFSAYLADDLITHLSREFNKEFSNLLNENLAHQDFSHYLTRQFDHYLSNDYKRDTSWHISKTFTRFLDQQFSLRLSGQFIRYFQHYFSKELCADFLETQYQRFETSFKVMIKSECLKKHGYPFIPEDMNESNIEAIYHCFLDLFDQNDPDFNHSFFNSFFYYIFFYRIKIWFLMPSLRKKEAGDSSPLLPVVHGPTEKQRKVKINKPFVTPFTFDFLLTCSFNHYIIKILAHLNTLFYSSEKTGGASLKKKEILVEVENFCRRYPFHSYIIREIWSSYALEYSQRFNKQNDSNSLRMAGFITQAAKISLITDMPCEGKEWEKILKKAEKSYDPFVRVALSLYNLTTYEDRKNNSSLLYNNMKEFREEYPDYFDMIGFE